MPKETAMPCLALPQPLYHFLDAVVQHNMFLMSSHTAIYRHLVSIDNSYSLLMATWMLEFVDSNMM